jgi:hypothetical protein
MAQPLYPPVKSPLCPLKPWLVAQEPIESSLLLPEVKLTFVGSSYRRSHFCEYLFDCLFLLVLCKVKLFMWIWYQGQRWTCTDFKVASRANSCISPNGHPCGCPWPCTVLVQPGDSLDMWSPAVHWAMQGRVKLFGDPRQWKNFRPLFQAVFLSWGGEVYLPGCVQHPASQSQDRNNKFFILYIEFCIRNKI